MTKLYVIINPALSLATGFINRNSRRHADHRLKLCLEFTPWRVAARPLKHSELWQHPTHAMSTLNSASSVNSTSSQAQTVTSLTAQTLNPGSATATILKSKGWLSSYWQLASYLLEAIGAKSSRKIHDDSHDIDLDKVVDRGRFPSRPSDLFLKVEMSRM